MLTTLKNVFKIKELRNKILFTLGMLVVIRFGSQLPVPGIRIDEFVNWFQQKVGAADSSGFLSAITGGSFENMSILALNITPYITSSITVSYTHLTLPTIA